MSDKDGRFTDDEIRIIEKEFQHKVDVIPRSEGKQEIRTQQYVGYIVLPNHVISIAPKIPSISFLNMVRYALHLPHLRAEEFELSEEDNYYDIIVLFLLNELERILQRGLHTGYKNYEESLNRLRGKILFKEQINNNYNRADRIYCSYSELSSDITENRIIKYTLHYLSQCYFPNESMNAQLLRYYRRLDEIDLIPVSTESFGSIEYTPLNEHYRTIITLCELFLRDSSLDQEKIGEKTTISFLIDMNKLFEAFVANLLIEKLEGYEVDTQKIIYPELEGSRFKIILDLLISKNGKPILILDTKYQEFLDNPKEDHIYQLYYYCSNTDVKDCCLIYPGQPIYRQYPQRQNIILHVILLDLRAANQFQFEEGCSNFINNMLETLRPLTGA